MMNNNPQAFESKLMFGNFDYYHCYYDNYFKLWNIFTLK